MFFIQNMLLLYAMKNKLFILSFTVLIVLASCLKAPQKASWDVSILAPLFKTTLDIGSFLPDSLSTVDTNNQVHIVYNKVLYEYSPDDILKAPDTITNQTYQSPFVLNLQPGQLFLNKSEQKQYKFGDAKLSILKVKSGFLNFKITNPLHEAILMTYTIPLAKKNDASFEFTELVPAATTVPYVFSKKIEISGYTIDMRGANGLGANLIGTILKARLNPDGVATSINTQDVFITNVKFEDFVLDYAKGYFSQVDINLDDNSNMDVFSIVKSGSFNLESLKINLAIVNGFGVDAQMIIDEMTSTNTISGQSILLHSPILGQNITIYYFIVL